MPQSCENQPILEKLSRNAAPAPVLAAARLPGETWPPKTSLREQSGFELKPEDAPKASTARWQHGEPGSAARPAKRRSSLLLAVGVWCRRNLLMMALRLPKTLRSRSVSAVGLLSPRFVASPWGRGCPPGVAPPKPSVFEGGAPAMPSGRAVGRRGGS